MNVEAPRTDELAALRARVDELEARLEAKLPEQSVSIVCFSGEWDRLFAAFAIASGALSMGLECHVFVTFWGAAALRDAESRPRRRRTFIERVIAAMLPGGPKRAQLSRLHFGGLGKRFFEWRMRRRGVPQLADLIGEAKELGVKIHVCETSADLLGMGADDFASFGDVDSCGVTTFLSNATRGRMAMFV